MDIRGLRYFNTIVDYGSFSAAARRLAIAQPALSRQIRLLEDELGTALLVRNPKGVAATEAGERLYRHVQALLHQFGQTPEVVRQEHGEVAGEVVIGLPTTLCAILARPFLRAALRRYPKVRIRLVESLGSVLHEMLENGRLDLAVLYNVDASQPLTFEPLMEEDLCLIGVPGQELEGVRSLAFRRLAQFPLVLSSTAQSLRRLLETMAADAGIRLNVRLEADSIHLTRLIAEEGLAFTVASHGVFHEQLARGTLQAVEIVDPCIRRSVSIVQTGRDPSRASLHMRRLLGETAKELVATGQWRATLLGSEAG